MHQIAKTVGVGQGTLYRHYANKDELCMDLVMESFLRFRDNVDAYLELTKDRTVLERLETVME